METQIHPLVLINMSDHWTRAHAQGDRQPILGALIGTQEGKRIDVYNCFELKRLDHNVNMIDGDYFEMRRKQYQEVFPNYEVLGLYSQKEEVGSSDAILQKQYMTIIQQDSSLLLLLNRAGPTTEDLPITLYEGSSKIGTNEEVAWTKLSFNIETSDAERIAVDHVTKQAVSTNTSDYIQFVGGLKNSVHMLDNRINIIIEYIRGVQSGRLVKNHRVLRQLLTISNMLQMNWQDEESRREIMKERRDALLCIHAASLTNLCSQLNEFTEKINTAKGTAGRGGH